MLGKYIDALPPAAVARIANAQAWRTDGYVDERGARCILGHAEDWFWDASTQAPGCHAPHLLARREAAGDSWLNWPPLISVRFDHLVERLTLTSAVRLVQRRAAEREQCGWFRSGRQSGARR